MSGARLAAHNSAIRFAQRVSCVVKDLPSAGKYMLAHAASAQGISAVENICSRPHVLNHNSVPAACFTHPEVLLYALLTAEFLTWFEMVMGEQGRGRLQSPWSGLGMEGRGGGRTDIEVGN